MMLFHILMSVSDHELMLDFFFLTSSVNCSATLPLDNKFHSSLKYDSVKIFKLSLPFFGSIKVQGGQDFLLECEDLDLPEQIEKIL